MPKPQLDKTEDFGQKITLERLILEIDSKILNSHHRIMESSKRVFDLLVSKINAWPKRTAKTLYMLQVMKCMDSQRKLIIKFAK